MLGKPSGNNTLDVGSTEDMHSIKKGLQRVVAYDIQNDRDVIPADSRLRTKYSTQTAGRHTVGHKSVLY